MVVNVAAMKDYHRGAGTVFSNGHYEGLRAFGEIDCVDDDG
jgi:hypothetical protein